MSERANMIAILAERIRRVDIETNQDDVSALLALSTAALAMQTLSHAEQAEKKARDDYNQRKFSQIQEDAAKL